MKWVGCIPTFYVERKAGVSFTRLYFRGFTRSIFTKITQKMRNIEKIIMEYLFKMIANESVWFFVDHKNFRQIPISKPFIQ